MLIYLCDIEFKYNFYECVRCYYDSVKKCFHTASNINTNKYFTYDISTSTWGALITLDDVHISDDNIVLYDIGDMFNKELNAKLIECCNNELFKHIINNV